jgi:hypothetical protein
MTVGVRGDLGIEQSRVHPLIHFVAAGGRGLGLVGWCGSVPRESGRSRRGEFRCGFVGRVLSTAARNEAPEIGRARIRRSRFSVPARTEANAPEGISGLFSVAWSSGIESVGRQGAQGQPR